MCRLIYTVVTTDILLSRIEAFLLYLYACIPIHYYRIHYANLCIAYLESIEKVYGCSRFPPKQTPSVSTPSHSTLSLSTPSISTLSIITHPVSTSSVSTPSLSTPLVSTPSVSIWVYITGRVVLMMKPHPLVTPKVYY